jgi:prevent-host-death family protein
MAEPTKTIPQRELRNRISEVLREVESGQSIRVTVSGRPVADLVPITPRPTFAPRALLEQILRTAPLDERFERDVALIMGARLDDDE